MSNYLLSPEVSQLEGTVQPDATRPWLTERAVLLTYPLAANATTNDTITLNVDRNTIGPFTPRSLRWLQNSEMNGAYGHTQCFEVSIGQWSRQLPVTLTGSILLPRSLDNVVINGQQSSGFVISSIYFWLSNLEFPEYETLSDLNSWLNGGSVSGSYDMYGSPVVIQRTPSNSSVFSSGLITAAGSTTITTENTGLLYRAQIHIAGNSTLAAAGNNKIQILNGTDVVAEINPYIPAAVTAGTAMIFNCVFESGVSYGGGLTLSIATAFATGGVEVNGWA